MLSTKVVKVARVAREAFAQVDSDSHRSLEEVRVRALKEEVVKEVVEEVLEGALEVSLEEEDLVGAQAMELLKNPVMEPLPINPVMGPQPINLPMEEVERASKIFNYQCQVSSIMIT